MKTYYSIVFIHDYEDSTADAFLTGDMSEDQMIEYLSQWDNGSENEHSPQDEPSAGTADNTYDNHRGYILSWNTGLGYVGLDRVEIHGSGISVGSGIAKGY